MESMDKTSETTVKIVVAALVRHADQYLFVRQRKAGGAYPDTLHLPGGQLELGEDPEQAIRREVLEETGLRISNLERFDFDYDFVEYKGRKTQFIFLRFTAEKGEGFAQPGSDVAELFWLKPNEIGKLPHNAPSQRLLRKLNLL
jgi:8-oxo-dGTP diphosphatase